MNSGSPIPIGDITHGQKYYDAIVAQTGCSEALDTLQCLREVPYEVLKRAQDASPSIDSYQVVTTPRDLQKSILIEVYLVLKHCMVPESRRYFLAGWFSIACVARCCRRRTFCHRSEYANDAPCILLM